MKGCDWLEKTLALKYKTAKKRFNKLQKQKLWAIFVALQKETARYKLCG